MMDFAAQMRKATGEELDRLRTIQRVTAIKLFKAVIMDTPVGNPELWEIEKPPEGYTGGNLRANWYLTIKTPSTRYSETAIDKSMQHLKESSRGS